MLTATARPARRSAVPDTARVPVNRQITITLASPSMTLPSAHPVSATDWAQDWYLLVIGAVAFGAATAGVVHRRRHRPGDTGHIAGMGIAYTAMLTAFYVDNGPHLPLWDRLPALTFWFLPSVIAAPVIARAIIRASRSRLSRGPS